MFFSLLLLLQLESFVKVMFFVHVLLDHLGCSLSKFLSNRHHKVSKPLGQLALPILQVVVLGGQ